jgi:hypothetical protein
VSQDLLIDEIERCYENSSKTVFDVQLETNTNCNRVLKRNMVWDAARSANYNSCQRILIL